MAVTGSPAAQFQSVRHPLLTRDLVFLFGAGASAGAGSVLPERPPLGAELYAELARLFPRSWGGLPSTLQAILAADFEAGMNAVVQEIGVAVPPLMRDMAVYFIQFRPVNRATLYNYLLARLAHLGLLDRTLMSTLNYECILEFAAGAEEIEVDYFGADTPGRLPVWKLHGSCNMFSAGIKAGQGISYSPGVAFDAGIEAFPDTNRVIEHCLTETGLAPVMCQYMVGKPTSVAPSAIRQLQARWAGVVESATAIACIGIRPHPPDEHIWEPLRKSPAQLYYVGGQSQFDTWLATRTAGAAAWLAERFDQALPHLLWHLEAL